MIIQRLAEYYDALVEEGEIDPVGWTQSVVSVGIVLDPDGAVQTFIPFHDELNPKQPLKMRAPVIPARTANKKSGFLVDNSKYFLGLHLEKDKLLLDPDYFAVSRDYHLEFLKSCNSQEGKAVRNFFQTWDPAAEETRDLIEQNKKIFAGKGNCVFISGGRKAQDVPELAELWNRTVQTNAGGESGICSVTGESGPIARLHNHVRGVMGAQTSGAALVSYNKPSAESYGHTQSYNSAVSEKVADKYTAALQYLVNSRKLNRRIGENTIIYWTQRKSDDYGDCFSLALEPKKDQDKLLEEVFKRVGQHQVIDTDSTVLSMEEPFYIMSLVPNAARLSVRFFYDSTFGNVLENLKKHYERVEIIGSRSKYIAPWAMLMSTVSDNVKERKPSPALVNAFLPAILSDGLYPEALLADILRRMRTDTGNITPEWAGAVKAYLIKNKKREDITVALNKESKSIPYQLGRLFSILEQTQKRATSADLSATIRDKYFGSAASKPAQVFPGLLKLSTNHLSKIKKNNSKQAVYLDKMIGEALSHLDDSWPNTLDNASQGEFMLGYYHQVQDFYTKKDKNQKDIEKEEVEADE